MAAAAEDVFEGEGEMGALLRSVDWAKTPIGPVEAWPQSLRTALSIVLASRHPINLCWGKDLVQLYNDAYRPILGGKHPLAVGRTVRETFAEIWGDLGPIVTGVIEQGRSTFLADQLFPLDRGKGFLEECYFEIAHSPIRDESGGIGGMFVTSTETTQRVLSERRLHTLRDLAVTPHRTAEQVCAEAARVLALNRHDFAFALIYLTGTDGKGGTELRLAGAVGIPPGQRGAPLRLDGTDCGVGGAGWPVGAALAAGAPLRVDDLPVRTGPLPGGVWPEPARAALLLPLAQAGQHAVSGVLIAGLSPRLVLDETYRDFLELVAAHVAATITNAYAFEEQQERARALAELNRARTAFFSNVSHEFRTPLTLMLGPVEEGLQDVEQPLPARQRARQETVLRNAQRLLRLVNMLLDFSSIEAGRTNARYRPTDLSALTIDLASAFRSLIEQAGLTLTVDCPGLPEPIYVDPQMYERLVLNLLSNAFKFTLAGGIHVAMTLGEGHAVLSVQDTGTGIPEADLPRVFDRFHRVENAKGRSFEGSGIGLALVHEFAKLHAAKLSVTSQLGKGSHFQVAFPLGRDHLPQDKIDASRAIAATTMDAVAFVEEAALWVPQNDYTRGGEDTAAAPTGNAPATDAERGRILLADDNADMRAYVRGLLVAAGFHVEAVADGAAALERARVWRPDLVLTDVMMPVLDGFGLLQAFRQDARLRHTPVVMLSARAGEEVRTGSLQAGADDYLVKPFSPKELVARVRIHLELARQRRAAESRRQHLNELFMQAPAPIAILRGPDHVFEVANPIYRRLVGDRDLVGKPVREALPEFENQPFFSLLDEVYQSGKAFVGTEVPTLLDRRGDGKPEEGFFNFVYQPMRGDDGAVEGILGFGFEVTTQVLARRQVELLVEQLKLADQRKDEFLAMLAHELRNPIAAISMALALLDRVEGDPAKAAKHKQAARRQMGNLTRLVDDLLDVARITRGTVEMRKERVDLANVVQDAVAATRPVLEARGHELSVTLAPGSFRLYADATRLEQVVVNLLTNAAKYTDPGGTIAVHLSRQSNNGETQAVLCVRDSGRGIPEDMLDKVFDLFVQVSPTLDRTTGGLGLGLTLVKSLVAMHGGNVTAKSDGPGSGSDFIVRLPLAEQAQSQGTVAPAPHAQQPATGVVRRRRIVVVEDSDDLRESMQDFLEQLGHDVVCANNGIDGVERLLELRPDVALVDVGLPGIDGYEVARRVRAAPAGEGLYLVALTGYGGPEARALAEAAGFDLHLTKPVDVDELPRVVSRDRHR